MLPLRFPRRWHLASVVLLLAVLLAMLMPAVWLFPHPGEFASWFGEIDKWLHGVSFAVLAIWFAGLYGRSAYWRIALSLLAFGMLIEVCQRLVGYRTADWLDVAADVGGIAIGLVVGAAGAGGWALHVESWMADTVKGDG